MDLNELLQRGPDPLPPCPALTPLACSADLAETIADALMLNGNGDIATRLELKRVLTNRIGGPEACLGGLCRSAVITTIRKALRQNPELTKADMLKAQIKTLEASIKPLEERLEQLRQALLEENSPFKINDVIEWKHGRSTRRGVVTGFTAWVDDDPSWQVTVIRQDNTHGNEVLVYRFNDPVKVTA